MLQFKSLKFKSFRHSNTGRGIYKQWVNFKIKSPFYFRNVSIHIYRRPRKFIQPISKVLQCWGRFLNISWHYACQFSRKKIFIVVTLLKVIQAKKACLQYEPPSGTWVSQLIICSDSHLESNISKHDTKIYYLHLKLRYLVK